MDEQQSRADRFEEHRHRLHAVAYRMLGSLAEADDAVQETWVRLSLSQANQLNNLAGWLTTVVARVCLNILRARTAHSEQPLSAQLPDPIIQPTDAEALLADSINFALLVVLGALPPAERLAFVLHDMFDVPFGEIASMLGQSSAAARQLASRARRRVKRADVRAPDADLSRQRQVVDAFFSASRAGDFAALVALLHPDVVLRADWGTKRVATPLIRGAADVTKQALMFNNPTARLIPALVNGAAGVVVTVSDRPFAVMGFTISQGRIVEIHAIAEPGRVAKLAATVLDHTCSRSAHE
jgi:RNA polymerase sigma factor (sigma-70 family)